MVHSRLSYHWETKTLTIKKRKRKRKIKGQGWLSHPIAGLGMLA
jgi:hypothetical protein